LSIGELAENDIGSNCGQHVMNYLREKERIEGGYTYPLKPVGYDTPE
jgi:23S rRNA (adenine2503-C2)-methyltransferase